MSIKVFISHASEDKSTVARPIARALDRRGYSVWYDEYVLALGDSLKRSIDRGLAECDFGVVILSPSFFAKQWTQEELGGLVARESENGDKFILPIWHDIDASEIRKFSPTLADRLAIPSSIGTRSIVKKIVDAIEPEINRRQESLVEYLSPYGGRLSVTFYANSAKSYDSETLREKFPNRMGNIFSEDRIKGIIRKLDEYVKDTNLKKK